MPAGRVNDSTGAPASQERGPLRVLHVDTERGWRGGERQVLWLAEGLARLGDASVIAARAGEPLAARAREAGLPVVELTPAFEADPRTAWRVRRAIREHRIDVVHAHAAHAVTIGALATLGMSVPLVVSRRVDFPLRKNAGTRWKYGRAAVVIAISEAVASILRRGDLMTSIDVVHDGTDMSRVPDPADATSLASLGVAPGAPLVVQVAQLVGHKDPISFVRAIARARELVPAIQALLVGDGPLRADVEREVRALGLGATVHVTGYRMDADRLLASADVVVLSSREEGMGSVLLDALVFGKPVAATRAGGIPEVVRHEVTGLLAPIGDPRALGDAIARLAMDTRLRARLGAAAQASAGAFSIDVMARRTRAIYERVLEERPR